MNRIVSMDNILGLLPENVSTVVDELMADLWLGNDIVVGYQAFFRIIGAYGKLGLDIDVHAEWKQDDVIELLNNDGVFVTRA